MSRLRRLQQIGGAALGIVGALAIAVSAALAEHPVWVAIDAPVGAPFMLMLIWMGYSNRRSTATTRRGLPPWSAGIGIFSASIVVVLTARDVGGAPIAGAVGGLLLTNGLGLVLVPRLLLADRY